MLSADNPISNLTLVGATSVKDLANATPRPSTSPELESMSIPGNLKYAVIEEGLSHPMTTSHPESEDLITEKLLAGSHFVPYNVETEPLPPGPLADPDYQKAQKRARTLQRALQIISDHVKRLLKTRLSCTRSKNGPRNCKDLTVL